VLLDDAVRCGAMVRRILALLLLMTITLAAEDWPQWRGPNRDGIAVGFREPAVWPEALVPRWKVEVGLGYATPLHVGDRLFVFTRQGEEEVMSALDARTGRGIWRTGYAMPFTPMRATARHGPGPKSTPAFANGRLFSLGMTGIVTAFDAASGRQLWQTPPSKAQPLYHTAMSPIVEGDRVIVHVGGPGDAALHAFDAATGGVRWSWTEDSPAYGSPIVATVAGTRQLVTFTHQYLIGIDSSTGALLWRRPFRTPSDTTAQTPIVFRDTIIQNGRDNGVTAFRVVRRDAGWTTEDLWQTKEVSLYMTNGVVAQGVLYGLSHLNAGQYFALDLSDGRVLWKSDPRQAENAAMVLAGTAILSLEDDGELVVMKASREGMEVLRRYDVADSATWAQPVIATERLLVKDVAHLALWTFN
jgi:outer membrane protein assembly factor BamB